MLLFLRLCAVLIVVQASTVSTTSGSIKGEFKGNVSSFLGIPYAAPPVGTYRWQPPVAHPMWSGTKETVRYGATCTQAEDCLFLNVWVPGVVTANANLPILFYVHGGCYVAGSGNCDGETVLAYRRDVIVASTNYRLGPFGFLGGDEVKGNTTDGSSGNFGLQDQRMALAWVKKNAQNFGGDPNKILLFGESAGAGSVAAHLAMPKSWGLFSSAGIESGAFALWNSVSMEQANTVYATFLERAQCHDLACLRALSPASVEKFGNIASPCQWRVQWAATVDGVELSEDVWRRAQDGHLAEVPVLLGTNRDEGSGFVVELAHSSTPDQLHTWWEANFPGFVDKVVSTYPPTTVADGCTASWWAGMDSWTDSEMVCPTVAGAEWITQANQPAFMYQFSHPGPSSPFVYHSLELLYVFRKLDELKGDADGEALSNVMVDYWANMAAHGNPGGQGAAGKSWPSFGSAGSYIDITSSRNITTKTNLKATQCALWTSMRAHMSQSCVPPAPKWHRDCGGT